MINHTPNVVNLYWTLTFVCFVRNLFFRVYSKGVSYLTQGQNSVYIQNISKIFYSPTGKFKAGVNLRVMITIYVIEMTSNGEITQTDDRVWKTFCLCSCLHMCNVGFELNRCWMFFVRIRISWRILQTMSRGGECFHSLLLVYSVMELSHWYIDTTRECHVRGLARVPSTSQIFLYFNQNKPIS